MTMKLLDDLKAAEKALFDHVGYSHDWRVFPVVDHTDQFWAVDPGEDSWCKSSPNREHLERWLALDDFQDGMGDDLYESSIYTYRHLKRWVFRGSELTMVLEDTHSDLNVWLAVYRNDMEVKAQQ